MDYQVNIDWNDLLDKIKLYAPRKTGALSDSWYIFYSDNTRAIYRSDLPYARIQDQGGTTPAVYGKLMVFEIGGQPIFTNKKKPSHIPGTFYWNKAWDNWFPQQT